MVDVEMVDAEADTKKRATSGRPTFMPRVWGGFQENVVSALRALALNWTRSALTMTGIVMGVLSIVTLVAILQGVKAEVARQVEGLGANLVMVFPGKLDENGGPNPMSMLGKSSLTERDVDALQRVPGVQSISPVVIVSGAVERSVTQSASALVVGTRRIGVEMNPTPLAEGRYFDDSEGAKRLCILGDKPRRELFGTAPVLGKTVRIIDKDWTVVGVLGKPKGDGTLGNAMLGLSSLVYLPYQAARKPDGEVNRIALKTNYDHPADALVTALQNTLRTTHAQRDDFGVVTQKQGLKLVIKLLNMAQALLVLISTISLVVAGVGIMNIMLVTVTERTREIGIRKTVGARRNDIFAQFVTEAITLSILGGAIGVLLSWAICLLIGRYSTLTPQITPSLIVMALAVCTAVGLLFGVTPAVRAARLDPIDALRHE